MSTYVWLGLGHFTITVTIGLIVLIVDFDDAVICGGSGGCRALDRPSAYDKHGEIGMSPYLRVKLLRSGGLICVVIAGHR